MGASMRVHAWILALLLPAALKAESVAATIVTLDMPHGGCRLVVRSDGSGSLAYGALPGLIRVKPGTFEPAGLADDLRRVAIPQSDGEHPRPPGTLRFAGSDELYLFADKEFARANFLKALSNAMAPGHMEVAGASVVERACRAE